MNEDRQVKSFFEQIKAEDSKRAIPEMELSKKQKFPLRTILAAAAVLVLLAWWQGFFQQEEELYKDTVVITLSVDENQNPELGIKATSTMNVWEAPTDFLLTKN